MSTKSFVPAVGGWNDFLSKPARVALSVGLVALAVVLWVLAAGTIDQRNMNDLGLVSIMPITSYIALAVLVGSFCFALIQRELREALLALHVVALIFMLYGLTALVQQEPRFPTAWTHAGFVEYIMRTGQVATNYDARFSWPGFFILAAFLARVAGLPDAMPLLGWMPFFLNVLYLGPLIMIAKSATADKRLVWLAVWLFFIGNWVSQDYFSPQGFNIYLYFTLVAILLRWFKSDDNPFRWLLSRARPGFLSRLAGFAEGWFAGSEVQAAESTPVQRVGFVAIAILLITVIASSHQLTPIATLLALGVLAVFGRISLRSLPVLAGVIIIGWISYMTVDFMSGHLGKLLSDIGQLASSVSENVTVRVRGSPEHMFIIYARLFMTVLIWGLALLGGYRRYRSGRKDLAMALLALAPFALLPLQSYGGEILLRIYFFALPFMAFFSAALVFPSLRVESSGRALAAVAGISALLLAGFLFARYGNERMDYVTYEETAGIREMYRIAPPGSRLVAPSPNLPWQFQNLEQYEYVPSFGEVVYPDMEQLRGFMSGHDAPAFLIITRSLKAYGEMFHDLPPGWGERLEQDMATSGYFTRVYTNPDVSIYTLAPGADIGGNQKP